MWGQGAGMGTGWAQGWGQGGQVSVPAGASLCRCSCRGSPRTHGRFAAASMTWTPSCASPSVSACHRVSLGCHVCHWSHQGHLGANEVSWVLPECQGCPGCHWGVLGARCLLCPRIVSWVPQGSPGCHQGVLGVIGVSWVPLEVSWGGTECPWGVPRCPRGVPRCPWVSQVVPGSPLTPLSDLDGLFNLM